MVNQREVGSDTQSLQTALKNALRQAPDVILIGEIRDREDHVGRHRLRAVGPPVPGHHARQQQLPGAEPHPVLLPGRSAPHACWATWPPPCKAVVSQRLLRTVHGSRAPAVEVMLNTKLVSELIEKGDFSGVKEAMEKSMAEGSQTFEQDIARLIVDGTVDRKEGLAYADSPTNLQWRLQNDFAGKDSERGRRRRLGRRPGRRAVVHRNHARRQALRAPFR